MLFGPLGQHYVRVMNRKLSFNNRPLRVVLGLFLVLLEQIDTFDNDSVLVPENLKDLALLALVITRNDDNLFSFFDFFRHGL